MPVFCLCAGSPWRWAWNQRRAVVAEELETLSSAGRLALVTGLTELTASRAVPPYAGPPPERP
jgi:hypothetical protein